MKVIFWGTRGSLPTPLNGKALRKKLVNALVKGAGKNLDTPQKADAFCEQELSFAEGSTFGGNSSCVQVDVGGPDYLICDLGSGVREFALAAIAKHSPKQPQTYHILVSHVHWDHIMGFPFFIPCFIPGNRIILYSCHAKLEQAIRGQNHEPCFPVEFESLGAKIEFVTLETDKPYDICGAKVTHGNGITPRNQTACTPRWTRSNRPARHGISAPPWYHGRELWSRSFSPTPSNMAMARNATSPFAFA